MERPCVFDLWNEDFDHEAWLITAQEIVEGKHNYQDEYGLDVLEYELKSALEDETVKKIKAVLEMSMGKSEEKLKEETFVIIKNIIKKFPRWFDKIDYKHFKQLENGKIEDGDLTDMMYKLYKKLIIIELLRDNKPIDTPPPLTKYNGRVFKSPTYKTLDGYYAKLTHHDLKAQILSKNKSGQYFKKYIV